MTTVERPPISVCMPTFNGARFVQRQAASILDLLADGDELVVTDDASQDDTVARLRALGDARVHISCHAQNVGVLANVEACLRASRSPLIFLADQDDVWLPHRVERVVGVFARNPDVTLVLTGAVAVDEEERPLPIRYPSLPEGRGAGWTRALRSVVKNRYLGCAMAFRRELLEDVLPLPPTLPMHDMWIGILGDLFGRSYYLPEPLILHRRHARTVTKTERAPLDQVFRWRGDLLRDLLVRVVERRRAHRESKSRDSGAH